MNERPLHPHPLDFDGDEHDEGGAIPPVVQASAKQGDESVAYQPLLKPSIRVLIASFVIVFFAGLAAGNASPNSTLEKVASVVNRLGMVVMLLAFCAILIAYRIPRLRKAGFTIFGSSPMATAFSTGARNPTGKFMTPDPPRIAAQFGALAAVNLGILFLVLATAAISASTGGLALIWIVSLMQPLYCALLVTMIVWHTGFLRAYAIGALTVIAPGTFLGGTMLQFALSGPMRGISSWPLTISLVIAPLAGLACALYVIALERFRSSAGRNKPSPED